MGKVLRITAILCLAALMAAPMAAAKMVIKYGHIAPPFHGQSKGVEAFAAYVKQKTGGEIEIRTFPFGQLGSERALAEQVQSGTLELASITTAVMQNYVPQAAVMDLPFVFPSRQAAYTLMDDPQWRAKLFSFFPQKGFVAIGWTENEFRDLNTKKTPIRKPADMKGLKIRVMNSPVYIDTFKQLGASPVGIPFPELYSALQQGVIDAQENPLYTSILIKALEVAKYVTDTDHILTSCVQVVNPDFWERLTPKQQQIFREAADLALKVNRETTKAHFAKMPKINMSMDEYCKKQGVEVITLTPAERQAFAEAMKPVWDKYAGFVGQDFYKFFQARVAAAAGKKAE